MTPLAPVAPDAPVFGVCRPGHLGGGLEAWIDTLRAAGVSHVVCLLSESEATRWGLPEAYADAFQTTHAPVRDRHLPGASTLETALSALRSANRAGERAALHCDAGLGRTGVVGAAWLSRYHGYEPADALAAVKAAGRAPREAVARGSATEAELLSLLDDSDEASPDA
jgi:protein-tyrosine phosphatase